MTGRALRLGAALIALLAALSATAPQALAVTAPIQPRTSLTAVWNDLMCPSCHEPLAVAQSPQAESERQYVQHLIAQGDTRAQVMREMVAQYGSSVLAKPPANGFNLLVYILPPALLAAGAALLIYTLPKWRARSRAAAASAAAAGPGTALSSEDADRLERDLARFD